MAIDASKRREQDLQRAWLDGEIIAKQQREWFGTITLKFEGGIMKVYDETSRKIPPVRGV
jgi:hypothetical protein